MSLLINSGKLILEPQSREDIVAYRTASSDYSIYEVKSGDRCFASFFYMNPDSSGAFNGDLYSKEGGVLSSLQSFIRAPRELVSYNELRVGNFPKEQKRKFIDEILLAAELALGHEGFKKLITNTHPAMAHILEEYHGWKRVGERSGIFDMEKEL